MPGDKVGVAGAELITTVTVIALPAIIFVQPPGALIESDTVYTVVPGIVVLGVYVVPVATIVFPLYHPVVIEAVAAGVIVKVPGVCPWHSTNGVGIPGDKVGVAGAELIVTVTVIALPAVIFVQPPGTFIESDTV